MILHIFTDSFTFEGKVISRIRNFLTSQGFSPVVSRDLQSDPMPPLMVWCRIIGPAVTVSEGFQYETFQITVSAADTDTRDGRSISSAVSTLIRAYMETDDFCLEPITNIDNSSGSYATEELDGFARPAFTFTASVYQTSSRLTV